EQNRAIEDVAIATVATLPEAVAEHDDFVRARTVLFIQKAATEKWLHAEQREEICTDCICRNALRLAITGEIETVFVTRGHVDKRLVLSFPVNVVCRRGRVMREARESCVFPNDHKLFGLLKREGPQQHRVNNTEDRGIRADA